MATVSGCGEVSGGVGNQAAAPEVDETADHPGQACPDVLAGKGFGVTDAARRAPSLATPQQAWVCHYEFSMGDEASEGRWLRSGKQLRVPDADLADVADSLSRLEPAAKDRSCTAELGPRILLAYSINDDLTGVVLDTFGCDEVRLSDNPFSNPPGEASQPGTVSGVLQAPRELFEKLIDISADPPQ